MKKVIIRFKGTNFRTNVYGRLLLIMFCVGIYMNADAGTIRWITFIDTNDQNVGEMDENGRNVLFSRFINVVNSSLSLSGYDSEITDCYGDYVTPENCAKVINDIKCAPSDIMVFYYIGHGFHSSNDKSNFPTMVLGDTNTSEKSIPLSWVHDKLKNKGARLVITIGSCSNVNIQGIDSKYETTPIPQSNQSANSIFFSKDELSAIQKAFLCTKGDIMISAASPGQGAFGGVTPMGSMDFLTAALTTIFEDLTYENKFSWEYLLDETASMINSMTDGKQKPIFHYNLQQVPLVDK